jgi:methylmalonyl-CoA/ethylmalonyl-CoA epimerase
MSQSFPMVLQHIGIVVKDIPAALPGYRAMGYLTQGGIVHDPIQTAHVQFLHRDGDPVSLELVAPDGETSKLANALKKGGGLNHLCYRTSDIGQALEAMHREGMLILQSPVEAVAFEGRRIAWLIGRNGFPIELVESSLRD